MTRPHLTTRLSITPDCFSWQLNHNQSVIWHLSALKFTNDILSTRCHYPSHSCCTPLPVQPSFRLPFVTHLTNLSHQSHSVCSPPFITPRNLHPSYFVYLPFMLCICYAGDRWSEEAGTARLVGEQVNEAAWRDWWTVQPHRPASVSEPAGVSSW